MKLLKNSKNFASRQDFLGQTKKVLDKQTEVCYTVDGQRMRVRPERLPEAS